jgi:hypothetical protein
MERHYPPALVVAQTKAHEAGIMPDQLKILKGKIASIHYLKPDAKNMPGASHHVLGAVMEFSIHTVGDLDVMDTVKAFADEYHRWTVANEHLASIDAFESSLTFHFPNLSASEIQEIKETVAKVAAKLTNPDTILHLHHMLIRHCGGRTIERVRQDLDEYIQNLIKSRHNLLISPLDQPHD